MFAVFKRSSVERAKADLRMAFGENHQKKIDEFDQQFAYLDRKRIE